MSAKCYRLLECMLIGASHSCSQCIHLGSGVLWWKYPQRPQDGNITTYKKVEFSELACMHLPFLEIRVSFFSEMRECTVVPLCLLSLPWFTHSFSTITPQRKQKSNTVCWHMNSRRILYFLFQWNYHFLFRILKAEECFLWEKCLNTFYFYGHVLIVHSDKLHKDIFINYVMYFDHIYPSICSPSPPFLSPTLPSLTSVYRWDLYICIKSRIHK